MLVLPDPKAVWQAVPRTKKKVASVSVNHIGGVLRFRSVTCRRTAQTTHLLVYVH